MILLALPFLAIYLGTSPKFVAGIIFYIVAMTLAGYTIAKLMWDAVDNKGD